MLSFYKENNAFIMCYVSFMFALNVQLTFLVPADKSTEFKNYGACNSAYILQTIFNLLYFGLMYVLWTSKSSFEQQQQKPSRQGVPTVIPGLRKQRQGIPRGSCEVTSNVWKLPDQQETCLDKPREMLHLKFCLRHQHASHMYAHRHVNTYNHTCKHYIHTYPFKSETIRNGSILISSILQDENIWTAEETTQVWMWLSVWWHSKTDPSCKPKTVDLQTPWCRISDSKIKNV